MLLMTTTTSKPIRMKNMQFGRRSGRCSHRVCWCCVVSYCSTFGEYLRCRIRRNQQNNIPDGTFICKGGERVRFLRPVAEFHQSERQQVR